MAAQLNQVIRWKRREDKEEKERVKPWRPLPADDEIVIACEDVDIEFIWRGKEVKEFIHMWEQGLSLFDIARAFPYRNPDDVIWLWMHCDYHGWISDRPGGIYGRRRPQEKGGRVEMMIPEIISNILNPVEFMQEWELFWLDGEDQSEKQDEESPASH